MWCLSTGESEPYVGKSVSTRVRALFTRGYLYHSFCEYVGSITTRFRVLNDYIECCRYDKDLHKVQDSKVNNALLIGDKEGPVVHLMA